MEGRAPSAVQAGRPDCEVAIIGAGPYGLSTAAHLKARGITVQTFGKPMSFWEEQMPAGMLLRSPWAASHLSDPDGARTLDRYRAVTGQTFGKPVPRDRFVAYGRWFQAELVPDIDQRTVAGVQQTPSGFQVMTEDGDSLVVKRVVVAAGIDRFARRPPGLEHLSPLVSHTVDHRDLGVFANKRVVVAGGGQSALESAALLRELGADVEVLVRHPRVYWLTRRWQHRMPVVSHALYAWPDVGPAGVSHLVARPALYRRMSRSAQDRLARKAIRAAGAAWLVPRLQDVPIRTGLDITGAECVDGRVRLSLSDGSVREADHLMLGTGFRVDVAKYPFLAPELVARVDRVHGYPRLTPGFESSVPGLHFAGAPAAWSHGPLMRFVAGAGFASRALARAAVRPLAH
ncbi:MAG: NAD(P)-binding domain-containing protein [Actinomycetota bacterium]|nr:NAD(P)-binding domain-containing protein [Actinomycetota bacterium]